MKFDSSNVLSSLYTLLCLIVGGLAGGVDIFLDFHEVEGWY